MKVPIAAICLICCLAYAGAAAAQTPAAKGPDVLIIYSTGEPAGTITGLAPDAVTLPTPVRENMKTLADRLAAALSAKGLRVRAVPALDVKRTDEILAARAVVIGSPSYFGNLSWQVKKLLDEVYGVLYRMKDTVKRPPHAAFSMAEIEPSAKETLAEIRKATAVGPTMIVLVPHTPEEIAKRIDEFAAKVAGIIK